MLDLLIAGGTLVDGEHEPRFADVGIEGGVIAAVGSGLGVAKRTVDARGKTVTPGFIDIHTHSDFTLPLRPAGEAKLRQGVTTDVTGNCGFSPFPFSDGDTSRAFGAFLEPDLRERWPNLSAYAEDLEGRGLGINVAPLVGLGTIRLEVIGSSDARVSDSGLLEIQHIVRRTLREGAFGASSGLFYPPGSFAGADELVAICQVIAEEGGLYATHMRNEADDLLDSVAEALEVSRRSGCRLQISHLKALGRRNWGGVEKALRHIEAASESGVDVWFDAYPYTAGSTTLSGLLPAKELDGGPDTLAERLANADERARLALILEEGFSFSLPDVVLATVPGRPELTGLRVVDAAAGLGIGPSELVLRLIEGGGGNASMVAFGMAEEDVEIVLKHPRSVFGSDGWTMATDAAEYTHPRSFSAAIRLLVRYARDREVVDLATAVAKLTRLPARRLGLADRGVVQPGHVADLVVFDLESLAEEATFHRPCVYPHGVEHVFVAGRPAVEDGQLTDERAGRVLRHARASF